MQSNIWQKMKQGLGQFFLNLKIEFPDRPDFSQEPIELTVAEHLEQVLDDSTVFTYVPFFSAISPMEAKKNGWVQSYGEYILIACLEFSRRYPNHELAKYWKSVIAFSDEEILDIAQGKIKVVFEE